MTPLHFGCREKRRGGGYFHRSPEEATATQAAFPAALIPAAAAASALLRFAFLFPASCLGWLFLACLPVFFFPLSLLPHATTSWPEVQAEGVGGGGGIPRSHRAQPREELRFMHARLQPRAGLFTSRERAATAAEKRCLSCAQKHSGVGATRARLVEGARGIPFSSRVPCQPYIWAQIPCAQPGKGEKFFKDICSNPFRHSFLPSNHRI